MGTLEGLAIGSFYHTSVREMRILLQTKPAGKAPHH